MKGEYISAKGMPAFWICKAMSLDRDV